MSGSSPNEDNQDIPQDNTPAPRTPEIFATPEQYPTTEEFATDDDSDASGVDDDPSAECVRNIRDHGESIMWLISHYDPDYGEQIGHRLSKEYDHI